MLSKESAVPSAIQVRGGKATNPFNGNTECLGIDWKGFHQGGPGDVNLLFHLFTKGVEDDRKTEWPIKYRNEERSFLREKDTDFFQLTFPYPLKDRQGCLDWESPPPLPIEDFLPYRGGKQECSVRLSVVEVPPESIFESGVQISGGEIVRQAYYDFSLIFPPHGYGDEETES